MGNNILVLMLARFEIWEGSISDLMCALSRGNIVHVKREYERVFLGDYAT
ncbi:MAG: hypothetical protein ACRD5E_06500 [Nitrososphaeraceae archaeon]